MKRVRDDACTRPQVVEQARPEFQIERRKQIDRDDSCLTEICLKEIPLKKSDTIGDARLAGILSRLFDQVSINLDANAAGAELLRGGNRNSAVSRSQIQYEVARRHFG